MVRLSRKQLEVYILICERAWGGKEISTYLGISRDAAYGRIEEVKKKMGSNLVKMLVEYHRAELKGKS